MAASPARTAAAGAPSPGPAASASPPRPLCVGIPPAAAVRVSIAADAADAPHARPRSPSGAYQSARNAVAATA
ncbi:hypothetical protein BU14_0101s0015 [Porphyra umbilicalis]|uniref:Uncharacterized protein n=1 Tax=Porphyra umbilicalis TaxID=2786 RepID=A0A1X6PD20_PORUM|nr:hypothetical protein BU14_0101s0015 [Porphyra umbilicalis]|eukprot:OSX78734.1 hypothetical protein BU14_0101s0015 [Porphyra umbilicalis]